MHNVSYVTLAKDDCKSVNNSKYEIFIFEFWGFENIRRRSVRVLKLHMGFILTKQGLRQDSEAATNSSSLES